MRTSVMREHYRKTLGRGRNRISGQTDPTRSDGTDSQVARNRHSGLTDDSVTVQMADSRTDSQHSAESAEMRGGAQKSGGALTTPTLAPRDTVADGEHYPHPRDASAEDNGGCPPEIAQVLKEFADVFPEELPLGLPPSRATDHRIDLECGAKPPGHRIYRMAPAEEV